MSRIRTRFAPSPTGPLHLGGVRTALYSYLFAKKNKGDFLLRIEDTDRSRFVEGAEEYIIESLNWCGIKYDAEITRQSEHKEVYRKYAEQLIQSGHAYYAFDSTGEIDAARKKSEQNQATFSYDSSVRMSMKNSLTLSQDETQKMISENVPHVIRLKVSPGEEIKFSDLIRGEVFFQSNLVDDKVLLKSDGMPTYHLAHIVDDYLMEITHAVRGEEWLPSAPAHILIYKYLGWESKMPQYAHLPLILKPDGKGKLSKRDGDKGGFPVFPLQWKDPQSGDDSSGYREQGYYPEAFINMLALLGWNPRTEQEIFSMDELIEKFSFQHVHKGGAHFNPEKAKWFNQQWLQKKTESELTDALKNYLKQASINPAQFSDELLMGAVHLLKPRVQFEHEMADKGKYLFKLPGSYDEKIISKKWKPGFENFFSQLAGEFSKVEKLTESEAENIFQKITSAHHLKPGDVLQLLRVLITGEGTGVDLFPMIALLGGADSGMRINNALSALKNFMH